MAGTGNREPLGKVGNRKIKPGERMKRITKWRAAAKRELIERRGDKRYIRRDAKGRIGESDDVSRSLSHDRRKTAKKKVKAGQGDRGDRRPVNSKARKKPSARK
jgi:hypothetical protein